MFGIPEVIIDVRLTVLVRRKGNFRTLIRWVEAVLALERVDNKTHGHVDNVDEYVGTQNPLPEVVPASE